MKRAARFDEQRLSGNPPKIDTDQKDSGIPKDSKPEPGPSIHKAAQILGRKGGQSTSEAKKQAAIKNGKRGGKPRGTSNGQTQS